MTPVQRRWLIAIYRHIQSTRGATPWGSGAERADWRGRCAARRLGG